MSRQIICSSTPTPSHRRKPLLQTLSSSNSSSSSSIGGGGGGSSGSATPNNSAKFGEFCGGTTAECAAICCCCPCSIVNLLVLVFYKVPAGICRRSLRLKRRRKLKKKELLQTKNHTRGHCGFDNKNCELKICLEDIFPDVKASEEAEKAVVELEKEMWQRFYGTGFWRSPSQRELESPKIKQTIRVVTV